ncbi:MAG: hypothetical protein OXF83_09910 [Anaerolineaceae bacterium]|nr:hypothetical protein [Anaerolineaceae bacterium]MCY3934413.1 hypothetical protein [Chloroflexota bacterium]MCY4008900.1 hypothetical protein [Anaerolineaceae bacterium]MCY4106731.1 hypothetical protein [Chloroflexota bacterium]
MSQAQNPDRAKRRNALILTLVVLLMFIVSLLLISNDYVRFPAEEVDANATLVQATIDSLLMTHAPPPAGIAAADYEATLAHVPPAQAIWLRQTATAQPAAP